MKVLNHSNGQFTELNETTVATLRFRLKIQQRDCFAGVFWSNIAQAFSRQVGRCE